MPLEEQKILNKTQNFDYRDAKTKTAAELDVLKRQEYIV